MQRRRRFIYPILPLFAAAGLAVCGGVRATHAQAQTFGGSMSAQSEKKPPSSSGDPLNRSLRGAALQLAAASLSDTNGGIATPLRLPLRVAVLPLYVERGSGGYLRPPMAEPVLRARFMDMLTSVRHGDAFVLAPLPSRDMVRIARMTPGGVGKNDKPDAKVVDAARKAGADGVLYGVLSPPSANSRDAVWLVTWFLMVVGSNKESAVVKANVATTLNFAASGGPQ